MHRALQFLATGSKQQYRCSAGDTLLALQPDGTLLPCRRLPVPLGNVMKTTLRRIYEEHPLLGELRDDSKVADGCQSCDHARQCGGGLRCLSHALCGDPFVADPGCWLASRAES